MIDYWPYSPVREAERYVLRAECDNVDTTVDPVEIIRELLVETAAAKDAATACDCPDQSDLEDELESAESGLRIVEIDRIRFEEKLEAANKRIADLVGERDLARTDLKLCQHARGVFEDQLKAVREEVRIISQRVAQEHAEVAAGFAETKNNQRIVEEHAARTKARLEDQLETLRATVQVQVEEYNGLLAQLNEIDPTDPEGAVGVIQQVLSEYAHW
jgi:chromosome segregation ATPase